MTAREVALRALYTCHTQGAWADGALPRELDRAKLDSRDAALCSRMVYGVLQNQLLLDYYLSHFVSRPLEQLEGKVRDILRLGAYQLLMLDKVPAMAAVDESVKLAKAHAKNPKAGGFVNAVLRNLDRSRDKLPTLPEEPLERLSVAYSHPRWLVEEFAQTLNGEELEDLLAADNAPAPITAQVNTVKTTQETLARRLAEEGVSVQPHPWQAGCLILERTGALEQLPAFQEGLFYIQDPAARLALLAAGPKPGERVLDLCAAPGGKSFAAAVAMGDQGRVLSRDLYLRKVKELARSAARLDLTSIEAQAGDATRPVEGTWDLIVADVPCSGLGIIRKKPDIRYKDPSGFKDLLPIQAKILDNAAQGVVPGGRVLYATCTLRPQENEEQVKALLDRRKNFTVRTMETLWPHRSGTDGFFYAVLVREVGA